VAQEVRQVVEVVQAQEPILEVVQQVGQEQEGKLEFIAGRA